MECERCGKILTGKQERWCSLRCGKLGLKALYKKRNKEKINAYRREYHKTYGRRKIKALFKKNECYFCGGNGNLVWHHAEYKPQLIVRMCDSCHKKLHKLLKYSNGNVGQKSVVMDTINKRNMEKLTWHVEKMIDIVRS